MLSLSKHENDFFSTLLGEGFMSRFFVDRPIFATVISIVVIIVGGVALLALPVAQYPEVTPPVVQISALYPGASAKVVADTVCGPALIGMRMLSC